MTDYEERGETPLELDKAPGFGGDRAKADVAGAAVPERVLEARKPGISSLAAAAAFEAYFVTGESAFAATERALDGRGAIVRELPIVAAASPDAAAGDRPPRTRFLEVEAPTEAIEAILASLRSRAGVSLVAAPAASRAAPSAGLSERAAATRPAVRRIRLVVTRG
jgi:hypothetical protein